MTRRTIRFGFLIGLTGGGLMALFAMTAMWATGHGFFTVTNLFAHTFWKDAPLDGAYTLASTELGLLIHLVMSLLVGTAIAVLVERGQLDAGMVLLVGVGVGAAVWVIQAFAWSALDPAAHSAFAPWILATAHVVFAIGAAGFLTWLKRHEQASSDQLIESHDPVTSRELAQPRPTRSGFSRPSWFGADTTE